MMTRTAYALITRFLSDARLNADTVEAEWVIDALLERAERQVEKLPQQGK